MSRAMTRTSELSDARLLDEDVWDIPRRLTEADLFAHGGPGWRRGDRPADDPEDDR